MSAEKAIRATDVFVHVVLVSFRPDVSAARCAAIRREQKLLGDRCGGLAAGILCWCVTDNLDQRKNYQIVQFSVFADRLAFERFRTHPAHAAFASQLREIADWVVGDVEAALPPPA